MSFSVSKPASRTGRWGNGTYDDGSAHIRAYCRQLATVVTIQGEIDTVNVDRVNHYLRRFVFGEHPVVLDMSDVSDFAAAGISVLQVFDELCRVTGLEWTLVASPAVLEVLGDDAETIFPIAHSVQRALSNTAETIVCRRQMMLPLIKKTA